MGLENICLGLVDVHSVFCSANLTIFVVSHLPILTTKQLHPIFLVLAIFHFQSSPRFLLESVRVLAIPLYFSLTRFHLLDLNPLLFAPVYQTKFHSRYLFESRKVEVVSELHVDVFAVLRVLWVVEVMRSQEDAFHERFGYSRKAHKINCS